MSNAQPSPQQLQALKFRCIGPPRGGRVLAVHGHPTKAATFYFGACAGGIWKTDDAGSYWQNISDGYLKTAAVGALTLSESDPSTIYAGMGESTIRLDVSYGDGVYKSTDAGKSWQHMGLDDTNHISEIRVHPTNPDLVYVAALGHAFGPNKDRGVYRSKDGGKNWELVLHRSEVAGATDLAMDVTNPRVLFASIYQVKRSFWSLESGGPDSGLWKTTDGGDTWIDITQNKGMPDGILGKIGVTISPANPNRVWALIEAEGDKAGLYRSEDGGDTWAQLSSNRDLMHRPWYYMHIFADPQSVDTVYITNLKMWKSTDGGNSFVEITTPHGDNHDLWIDPNDPQRMIEGNDGGACVSFNGGASWSTIYNQKTAQFYHVATDTNVPYRVYGTQQDNSCISTPSHSPKGGIAWTDSYPTGTGESGYVAIDPRDPNIVISGAIGSSPGGGNALQRYDHRTRQIRLITTWPESNFGYGAKEMMYRFAWTYPIMYSPHDPEIIYAAGNHIFRTKDEGQSWEAISPDLSRNDPSKQEPSGGLTLDTSGAETYATVFSFIESPHEADLFWAGTDDGLVHISRDGGKKWSEITPPDLPEWTLISMIEPSPTDPATIYMAATRYKLDDYAPYLYKTSDYGATWQKLDSFPADEITRCVRIDPVQEGLIYVGTETGIFVSFDDGATWQRLQNNLPVVPIYDMVIKENDIVVGTHGRSFWILDDVTPLRTIAAQVQAQKFAAEKPLLFTPAPTVKMWENWFANIFRGPGKNYMMGLGSSLTFTEERNDYGEPMRDMLDSGENPPPGVIVYYALPKDVQPDSVSLTFSNVDGSEIHSFYPKPKTEPKIVKGKIEKTPDFKRYLSTAAGLNRFVWNMRYPDCIKPAGDAAIENATTGPVVPPGSYQVTLKVGNNAQTEQFEIQVPPNISATQEDLQAQFDLWVQIHDKLNETNAGAVRVQQVRRQVQEAAKRHAEATVSRNGSNGASKEESAVAQAAAALVEKLSAVEQGLIQPDAQSGTDRLRLPGGLNAKLLTLISVVASCDAGPTQACYDVNEHLQKQVDEQLSLLDGLMGDDVAAFNALMAESAVPAVVV